MEEIKLDVQVRTAKEIGTGKSKGLRNNRFVPAVVYGGTQKPTTIKLNQRDYGQIMRKHKGETVLFHLNVFEGDKKLKDYTVILKEEQIHPVTDDLMHVDFKRISLKEEIEVKVHIALKGDAVGVKKDGGVLEQILWELDIICLPTNIPKSIDVDISPLHIGQSIHVKELILPQGVKTKHDPESVVVAVVAPKAEEEVVVEGDALTEPEVLKEKKPEEKADAKKGEVKEAKKGEAKEEGKAEKK